MTDDPTNESVDPNEEPADKVDRVSGHDIVRKGMADLQRNPDDVVDGDELLDYVAERIEFDVDAERRRKALKYIANERKHGSTEPDGVLHFDGIDPYDYEPDRLVMDETGGLVENSRARPAAKSAEARRSMAKATEQMAQAQRRQAESSNYSDWYIVQIKAGTRPEDLAFGTFKRWLDDNPLGL